MDLDIEQHKKPVGIIAFLVVVTILVLCYYLFFNDTAFKRENLEFAEVKQGNMEFVVIASGKLQSKVRRWISSQSSGIVTDIYFNLGDTVEKTDALIKLENPQIIVDLQSSKTALKILESELLTEKYRLQNQRLDIKSAILNTTSELGLAEEKLKAEQRLADSGIFSKMDLYRSKSKVEQLKHRLEITQQRHEYFTATFDAQLQTKKAKIEELELKSNLKQTQFDNLSIQSPIDGIVQEINTEIGKRVDIGRELALVVQEYPLVAKIQVNQGTVSKISLGMPVTIVAIGNEIIGYVSHIAPRVVDGAVEVQVELPSDYPSSLKPQLIISATFKLNSLNDILWLPRPNTVTQGVNTFYKIAVDGNSAIKTKVTVGEISSDKIQIVSGLNINDKVILNGNLNSSDRITLK